MTPNPETKLLACPFCKVIPKSVGEFGYEINHTEDCFITALPVIPLGDEKIWNTRATPQPLVEVKDLEKVAEKLAKQFQHATSHTSSIYFKLGILEALTESAAPLLLEIANLKKQLEQLKN